MFMRVCLRPATKFLYFLCSNFSGVGVSLSASPTTSSAWSLVQARVGARSCTTATTSWLRANRNGNIIRWVAEVLQRYLSFKIELTTLIIRFYFHLIIVLQQTLMKTTLQYSVCVLIFKGCWCSPVSIELSTLQTLLLVK